MKAIEISDPKRIAQAKRAMMTEGNLTLNDAAKKFGVSAEALKREFVPARDLQAMRSAESRTKKAVNRLHAEEKKIGAVIDRINSLVGEARLSDEQAETLIGSIREAVAGLGKGVA